MSVNQPHNHLVNTNLKNADNKKNIVDPNKNQNLLDAKKVNDKKESKSKKTDASEIKRMEDEMTKAEKMHKETASYDAQMTKIINEHNAEDAAAEADKITGKEVITTTSNYVTASKLNVRDDNNKIIKTISRGDNIQVRQGSDYIKKSTINGKEYDMVQITNSNDSANPLWVAKDLVSINNPKELTDDETWNSTSTSKYKPGPRKNDSQSNSQANAEKSKNPSEEVKVNEDSKQESNVIADKISIIKLGGTNYKAKETIQYSSKENFTTIYSLENNKSFPLNVNVDTFGGKSHLVIGTNDGSILRDNIFNDYKFEDFNQAQKSAQNLLGILAQHAGTGIGGSWQTGDVFNIRRGGNMTKATQQLIMDTKIGRGGEKDITKDIFPNFSKLSKSAQDKTVRYLNDLSIVQNGTRRNIWLPASRA